MESSANDSTRRSHHLFSSGEREYDESRGVATCIRKLRTSPFWRVSKLPEIRSIGPNQNKISEETFAWNHLQMIPRELFVIQIVFPTTLRNLQGEYPTRYPRSVGGMPKTFINPPKSSDKIFVVE